MRNSAEIRSKTGPALAAALCAAALLLGGCSGRDAALAEQSAAAEQSALRAEQAAQRAELAANKAEKATTPAAVAEAEAEPAEDTPGAPTSGTEKPLDPTPTDKS